MLLLKICSVLLLIIITTMNTEAGRISFQKLKENFIYYNFLKDRCRHNFDVLITSFGFPAIFKTNLHHFVLVWNLKDNVQEFLQLFFQSIRPTS